ncbi:MAG: hypothetical protein ABWY20_19365 [Mycobacterium sp.]
MEWERAAIVAAFVVPEGARGRPRKNRGSTDYNVTQFTNLGITGLRDHGAVERYLKAWGAAGMPRPRPGTTIELPRKAWRDAFDASKSGGRPRATVNEIVERAADDESYARNLTARIAAVQPQVVASAGERVARAERETIGAAATEQIEHAVKGIKESTARALGVDVVVDHLRAAASELAHAINERDALGVTDTDAEAEALANIKRMLKVYETGATFTDGDAAFLEGLGIAQ